MQTLGARIGASDGFTPILRNIADGMQGVLQNAKTLEGQIDTTFSGRGVNRTSKDIVEMQRTVRDTAKPLADIERQTNRNRDSQKEHNDQFKSGEQGANSLLGTLKKFISIYAIINGVKTFVKQADEMTSIDARLRNINDGLTTQAQLQDYIFQSAQDSRGAYDATADAVAKLSSQTEGVFADNKEIVDFTEVLNKQFALSGTSVQGQAAAMLQLTQAMGMGILRGEEFNSVVEQAPEIIQLIAKEMGVSVNEMRDLASQGEITADIVKDALLNSADEVNAKFEAMPMTFGQAMQKMKNQIAFAFKPLFNMFSQMVNSPMFNSMMDGVMKGINVLVNGLIIVGHVAGQIADFIYDNWSVFEPLFYIIGTALSVLLVGAFIQLAIAGGKSIISLITKLNPLTFKLMLVGAAIGFTMWAFGKMEITAVQVGETIGGVMFWLGSVIYNFGILIINSAIIAGQVLMEIAISVAEGFLGVVSFIVSIFSSLLTFIINGAIRVTQFLINRFIDVGNGIVVFLNVINKAFVIVGNGIIKFCVGVVNSFISNIENMVNRTLNALNVIIKAVNKVPGINIGTVGGIRLGRVQAGSIDMPEVPNLMAHVDYSDSLSEYENPLEAFNSQIGQFNRPDLLQYQLEYKDTQEAWNNGAEFGGNLVTSIQDGLGGIIDGAKNAMDVGQLNNLDMLDGINDIADNMSGVNDAVGGKGTGKDVGKNTKDIKKNSDEQARAMRITNDNLDNLKAFAERRHITQISWDKLNIKLNNKFTGDINNNADLDGWTTSLVDSLSESLESMSGGISVINGGV